MDDETFDEAQRIRDKASEILKEDEAGARDLHNLTLSMGLHAVRQTFHFMVDAFGENNTGKKHNSSMRKKHAREISQIHKVTEIGCMNVEYNTSQGKKKAYIRLDKCDIDHNLDTQLNKIRPFISDEKWPELIRHISVLVFFGRSTYSNMSRLHSDLIKKILCTDDNIDQYYEYKIDMTNTTLFVLPEYKYRIGIFIDLEEELNPLEAELDPLEAELNPLEAEKSAEKKVLENEKLDPLESDLQQDLKNGLHLETVDLQ